MACPVTSKEPAYVARNGASDNMRRRKLEPAVRLADRLAAEGRSRDAEIIRRLLKSHSGQRGMLQNYVAMVQRTPSGASWNRTPAAVALATGDAA